MKIQRIPAQITTVEDKIAGNLNLTQITFLIVPIFIFVLLYAVCPPSMQVAWYKVPVFLITGSFFPILAIRLKEKLLFEWVIIILRYNVRPAYYVFNKNDISQRTIDIHTRERKHKKQKTSVLVKKQTLLPVVTCGDLVRMEGLLTNPEYSFSIKSHKKGVFSIAIEQKQ